ncbi:MAG: amidohydrolase family protein [Vulcanococcus sp.]|jgi:cytosine deaminase
MAAPGPEHLRLRLPRCLLDPGPEGSGRTLPAGDGEGLLAVELRLAGGRIAAVEALAGNALAGAERLPLALPPLLEPHAHLDKAFSWSHHPNPGGSMAGALAANGAEAARRTAPQVLERGERALRQAWRYGLRGLRSHIDSGGPQAQPSWEALLELRRRWQDRLTLQLAALVPLAHWSTPAGASLAGRLAAAKGPAADLLLGGVLGPPFAEGYQHGEQLRGLLRLADRHGLGLDLHIDESDRQPGRGLRLLLHALEAVPVSVPITCSHCCSLALLPEGEQRRLAAAMARRGIAVVVLPSTNLWLLGRRRGLTGPTRPIAPLQLLQQEGVHCAIGGDNVQDPWYPGGDFDPIELLRLALPALQLAPWRRQGLMPFSTTAAQLMGLAWDGVLRAGAPADLLVLGASSWSELLARPPQRRVLRGGQWLEPPEAQQPDPRLGSLGG